MKKKDVVHHKRKSLKYSILLWAGIFLFIGVLIMLVFALSGSDSIGNILSKRTYWLLYGVASGIVAAGYLMMYRIDAQNIAMKENDLEDTEWLTTKQLKKMKEFEVINYNDIPKHKDGIVIGAEKKGKDVEVITTSQLHALIVGTTGSGKTTGFVDQNISVLCNSKTKPSMLNFLKTKDISVQATLWKTSTEKAR